MPRSDFWSGLAVAGFLLLALLWMIPNYAGSNPFARMLPGLVNSVDLLNEKRLQLTGQGNRVWN